MTIHWKAVEQCFTVVLFNPLTPRVKLSVNIHWNAVEQYFTVVWLVFPFYPICKFEKFALSGVRRVNSWKLKIENSSCNAFVKLT